MEKPFSIKFNVISEIRHGSAYSIAEIEVIGNSSFSIPANCNWQNKSSWSPNGSLLALIQWDIKESQPGFKVIIYDSSKGEVFKSDRISGCCHKIRISNDMIISYESFTSKESSRNKEKEEFGIIKGKITGYNSGHARQLGG